MNKDHLRTFIFPETQFMAVTAYQNHMVCIVQFTSSFVVRNKKLKHATLVSQGWKPEVSFLFFTVCLPNLYCSSHYQIYIVKCLYTRRDDYFENLGKATVLACEMFTSGFRPVA